MAPFVLLALLLAFANLVGFSNDIALAVCVACRPLLSTPHLTETPCPTSNLPLTISADATTRQTNYQITNLPSSLSHQRYSSMANIESVEVLDEPCFLSSDIAKSDSIEVLNKPCFLSSDVYVAPNCILSKRAL